MYPVPSPAGNTLLLFWARYIPQHPAHRQNMEDEDVEERENDEENLLSESPELQSLAIGTTIGNKWKVLGYLQYCKFGFTQIVADLTKP